MTRTMGKAVANNGDPEVRGGNSSSLPKLDQAPWDGQLKLTDPLGGDWLARGKTLGRIGYENSADLVDLGVSKETSRK